MWVESVIGSHPCSDKGGFSLGFSVFSSTTRSEIVDNLIIYQLIHFLGNVILTSLIKAVARRVALWQTVESGQVIH